MSDEPKRPTLLQSFNHAFQGMVHAVRSQRNMRIHLAVAVVVLVASVFLNLTRLEFVAVLVAISLVLMMELVNTAVEIVVDMVTDKRDPRARVAKDLAAGAVLVAAINALAVAYLVLTDRLTGVSLELLTAIRRSPVHLTIVALALVIALVIAIKAIRGKGTPLSGGLPSGHAALAFAGWTAVTFVVGTTREGLLASAIAFMMAVLVAQSRLEAKVHSLLETVLGALLGVAVTVLVFQLWF
ncbi:MAG: diacylglycerol kinase [Thermoleophilia bacterium]|nr:diacylglycerol kinase [Thermoleophilia bacterium]